MTVSTPAPPNLLSPEHVLDPWPGLAVLREHYPVYWDEAIGTWLISRYDDIRPIIRRFGPGPAGQDGLGQFLADATAFFAMDGLDHRRRRALLAPFFARSGVESLHDRIERQALALLEPIFERERDALASGRRDRGEMDFVTEFTAKFSINVMTDILGLDVENYERIHAWFEAWIGAEGNISGDREIFERALWAKEDFGDYIGPIIAERRTRGGDDLISLLCHAELDGFSLPDEEIRSIAAIMILGGGETTDHQLGWLMHELIRHPDQQQAVTEERSLMDQALAEGMRYCSIIQYMGKRVPEDLKIADVTIGAGSHLALVFAAGNHDPRRWQNPDEFNIYRTDLDATKAFTGAAEHLGFGGGPHFCIGSHLSKAEMEIALNIFFDNARDVRFADGFEPRAQPDAVFARALPNLKLTFAMS
jgi:cytochrome P450